MWKTINEILKRQKNNDPISKIIHEKTEITNSKDIAETLSNYYKNAALEKINKIKVYRVSKIQHKTKKTHKCERKLVYVTRNM